LRFPFEGRKDISLVLAQDAVELGLVGEGGEVLWQVRREWGATAAPPAGPTGAP
jgi:hypothetical protein